MAKAEGQCHVFSALMSADTIGKQCQGQLHLTFTNNLDSLCYELVAAIWQRCEGFRK